MKGRLISVCIVLESSILAIAPVPTLQGTSGTVAFELSSQRLAAHRCQVRARAIVISVGLLAIGLFAALWISRSLETVRARTKALHARNTDMRLVLETMGQGFVMLDRDACMSSERSAILETWLGPSKTRGLLWDYIAGDAPDLREYLVLGWSEVIAGVLPLELALAQMPSRFSRGKKTFDLDYRPTGTDPEYFERMLVVISDITAAVERERAETDEREMAELFSKLMRDREG